MLFWESQSELQLGEACNGALRVLAAAEGREAEVAFTARTEACARRADDVDFVQELVEEVPRAHVVRRLEPDVRGIDAAVGC